MTRPDLKDAIERCPVGIPMGAAVFSLDGALPVEHLYVGDRLVSRRGSCTIKAITVVTEEQPKTWVKIDRDAFGNSPDQDMFLSEDQKIFRRTGFQNPPDSRLVKAGCLVGQSGVKREVLSCQTVYQICVGRPEVIYVGGLQLLSADGYS